jgi:hypothetical protein
MGADILSECILFHPSAVIPYTLKRLLTLDGGGRVLSVRGRGRLGDNGFGGSGFGGNGFGGSGRSWDRLFFNAELDAEHGAIEGDDRETEPAPHPGFPTIRDAFFEQKRGEVVHATTEEGEERRGAIQEHVRRGCGRCGEGPHLEEPNILCCRESVNSGFVARALARRTLEYRDMSAIVIIA